MIHTDNRSRLAWYAVLLGYPVFAQVGAIFAGFLKILPVFIMVVPGVIGYVLFRDVIGENSNQTLPILINQLTPTGLKGLISAGLLAALMSTIAAALNSSATLVAVDKEHQKREVNQREGKCESLNFHYVSPLFSEIDFSHYSFCLLDVAGAEFLFQLFSRQVSLTTWSSTAPCFLRRPVQRLVRQAHELLGL